MASTLTVYRWRIRLNGQLRTTRQHYAPQDICAHHPDAIRIDSTWRVLPTDAVATFEPGTAAEPALQLAQR